MNTPDLKYIDVKDITDERLSLFRVMRENMHTPDNSFIADSEKVVLIILKSQLKVVSLLATPEFYEANAGLIADKRVAECFRAVKDIMSQVVGYKLHHGVMLRGIRPLATPLEELGSRILVFDQVNRLDNVGTLCRSAAALGVDSILFHTNSPHLYARRVVRVSMGHVHKLKFHKSDNIKETLEILKTRGYQILGAETFGNVKPLNEITAPEKWALVLGNEGKGMSSHIMEMCDQLIKIPQRDDISSLNTGTSASIIMYHLNTSSQSGNIS